MFLLGPSRFCSVPCLAPVDDLIIQLKLNVLGGCLCVLDFYSGDCHNVWVMKEYGAGDSRTKFTINRGDFCLWKPLCIPRTGKVLLDVRQKKLV